MEVATIDFLDTKKNKKLSFTIVKSLAGDEGDPVGFKLSVDVQDCVVFRLTQQQIHL